MKKIFSFFVLISVFFSQNIFQIWETFAELPTANFSWWANAYEWAKKYEFVLDLKWSVLEEAVKRNKSRLSVKWKNSRWEDILWVSNVNEFEEKLVLRLTWKNWKYIDFTNFDYPWTKKFHDIYLIKKNWRLKADVIIYIHKDLDYEVYSAFSSWLKSAKYLYLWMKRWKPYKKARSIKIK